MNSKSKTVTALATLGAMIFVAMTLDRALTPYLPLSAAFLTLTVTFTFALIKPQLWTCAVSGIIFGVSSCLTALMFGKAEVANPLISILPRAFLGFIIFGVYKLMRLITKRMNPRYGEPITIGAAAALTTLSNTVLFLTAMGLFGTNNTVANLFKITVFVNALPEFFMTMILVPTLTIAMRRALRIDVDGRKVTTADTETTADAEATVDAEASADETGVATDAAVESGENQTSEDKDHDIST